MRTPLTVDENLRIDLLNDQVLFSYMSIRINLMHIDLNDQPFNYFRLFPGGYDSLHSMKLKPQLSRTILLDRQIYLGFLKYPFYVLALNLI